MHFFISRCCEDESMKWNAYDPVRRVHIMMDPKYIDLRNSSTFEALMPCMWSTSVCVMTKAAI